jgi:acyl carrier protein
MIADEVREILAEVTGRPEMLGIPAEMPLFGQGVALGSLTGTLLLREIRRRFGVDVAGEDLNLDALATLGTLAAFIGEQVAGDGGAG